MTRRNVRYYNVSCIIAVASSRKTHISLSFVTICKNMQVEYKTREHNSRCESLIHFHSFLLYCFCTHKLYAITSHNNSVFKTVSNNRWILMKINHTTSVTGNTAEKYSDVRFNSVKHIFMRFFLSLFFYWRSWSFFNVKWWRLSKSPLYWMRTRQCLYWKRS